MKVFGDITTIKNGSENVCTRVWVVLKRKSTPIVLRLTLHKINKKKNNREKIDMYGPGTGSMVYVVIHV
jgi:hypothetical protein